jgi:hypothetical protein
MHDRYGQPPHYRLDGNRYLSHANWRVCGAAQPHFVSDNPADLLALAITFLAATRLSMLPTVLIGIASAGLLRHLVG